MTLRLSTEVRRLVAIALLLGVMLLGWSIVVDPLIETYRDAKATIASLAPAIERGGADGGADLADLTRRIERLKSRQAEGAGLLSGTNESIAAAQLQTRLKSISDAAKGDLKSTQILASHDDGNFRRVTVRGQISGNLSSVLQILYALESTTPYLFLDDLDIRLAPGVSRGPADAPPSNLDLRLDVSGYLRRAT